MLKLKSWLLSLLVLAITAVPVMAGSNDAKTGNGNAANTTNAEASPAAASPSPSLVSTAGDSNVTALIGVLVTKGVLAPTEANAIRNAAPAAQFQALVEALSRKGLVSAADLSAAANPAAQPSTLAAAPVAVTEAVSTSLATMETQSSTQAAPPPPPAPPAVIPAVVPIRFFPVDPPKTGGLSGIKVGPLTLAPYGFIKATVVHDSSNPNGDDFPFPDIFLGNPSAAYFSTGPTKDPEVHVKARSTRFGLNLEWPDISKNLTLTGKIEGDFEGNFTEVDNRDISSLRSSQPTIRLAYVRMDYHASENTDIFFVGGQDWTLFGSGALPNILETTGLGFFYGDVYTRSPQLRVGFIQNFSKEHKVNLEGQFGIMMPSSGQILKLGTAGLAGQLAEGEREGADSDRPEWEGRVALSFQLDPARGVAPAQIALAGFRGSRTSIAFNSSAEYTAMCETTNYCAAGNFPNGFQASSKMYGGQITLQLPTRWFTLVGSAFRGGDLRFYFAGQINSFATDTGGLDPASISAMMPTLDGGPLVAAGAAVLGCPTGDFTPGSEDGGTCSVKPVVAPQRPIRAFGGMMSIGFPLSRWFNADPKGHNAGWQLYFTIAKDQAVHRDLLNPNFTGNANIAAPLPMIMGKMALATLYYKFNNWCQFGFEQSIFAGRIRDGIDLYTIAGVPSNEWQDHRTEFGPIFTF